MGFEINEVQGTLNVADSLNVGRVTNLRGDLNVTGNLRVQGVCYIENVEDPSADTGQPSAAALVEELRTALQSEITARRNADTTLENAIGLVRIDTAGAQSKAREAAGKAEDAQTTASGAASAAETARLRAEKIGTDIRRDLEWWIFPTAAGSPAVSTDGESSITFAKEGFYLCAGGERYHLAPTVGAAVSINFSAGETGYLCLNIERIYKMQPGQTVNVSAVIEKVLNPTIVQVGTHIPVAYVKGGQFVKFTGIFADLFS